MCAYMYVYITLCTCIYIYTDRVDTTTWPTEMRMLGPDAPGI